MNKSSQSMRRNGGSSRRSLSADPSSIGTRRFKSKGKKLAANKKGNNIYISTDTQFLGDENKRGAKSVTPTKRNRSNGRGLISGADNRDGSNESSFQPRKLLITDLDPIGGSLITPTNEEPIFSAQIVTPETAESEITLEESVDNIIAKQQHMKSKRSIIKPSEEYPESPPQVCQVSSASSDEASSSDAEVGSEGEKDAKHRMHFGYKSSIVCQPNVRTAYRIMQRRTGFIGGNGSGGAIYGELTMGSMQKMVNAMKEHTDFNADSRFIDVGCGLGKPNIHVAQDPGVQFSYGIEMERVRWFMGMHNLTHVLEKARSQRREPSGENTLRHNCILAHGDITEASTFDPFTHVYMFDIGFPPKLFKYLSAMFNRSQSPFLICYHGPRLMIERYKFDLEFITQIQTSMHGSSEGHMGYLYKRSAASTRKKKRTKNSQVTVEGINIPCDPLFVDPFNVVGQGLDDLSSLVSKEVNDYYDAPRPKRQTKSTYMVSPSV
mmetsp:Transcript_10710/g.12217  ORF Transcript_10710/g.12217 Transcript_10710/m.12217 type:complete len:493 (-) Transcript_10710:347-1825(-)